MIGRRLNHYEIIEPLGAGGMGEVYRAHDTKLKRDVAIKVLPEELAADAERLARLEREAQLLAALNHPHIAAIHGIEEEGEVKGLVLELVEGQTLAERIARGPVALQEALKIAVQIADALECAHGAGIIHRDLKPANVKVTPEGKVKVLDFGLAKSHGAGGEGEGAGAAAAPDITESPTVQAATAAGVILGTAAYMSPEQARGHPADKRADIWGLGLITCEMLVGQPMFAADTVPDTLATVLTQEPDWERVAAGVPESVLRVLRRCLSKEVETRFRDIGDVGLDLQEILDEGIEAVPARTVSAGVSPATRGWQIAAAALALVAIASWVFVLVGPSGRTPGSTEVSRFSFRLPRGEMIATDMDVRLFDISADGRNIAWVSQQEPRQIYVRSMDSREVRVLPGTEGALNASVEFSPDGGEVAYVKNGELWTAPIDGGLGQRLMTGRSATDLWDFDWARDGSLLISVAYEGIFRLGAPGEKPELLYSPDSPTMEAAWVRMLPGARAFLFATWHGLGSTEGSLHVLPMDDPQATPRLLLDRVWFAEYAPTGHLVFWSEGAVHAVRFNLDTLETEGAARPLVSEVQRDLWARVGEFAFADNGTLVYIPEQDLQNWRLAWASGGAFEFVKVEPDAYWVPRISRSGDQFLVLRGAVTQDPRVYVSNLEGAGLRAITSPDHGFVSFSWGHDDSSIVFIDQGGTAWVQEMTIGASAIESFAEPGEELSISDVSPDGSSLLLSKRLPRDVFRIQLFDIERGEFTNLTPEGNIEHYARFSPDGRWIAYVSDEEGGESVWVREVGGTTPAAARKFRVSPGAGWYPVWSRDGDEIFYLDGEGQTLRAVSFRDEPELRIGEEHVVLDSQEVELPEPGWIVTDFSYDVGPDGRFLLVAREPIDEMVVNITLNWFEELKRMVPTER
jgi:serine/threonine-protein kinase